MRASASCSAARLWRFSLSLRRLSRDNRRALRSWLCAYRETRSSVGVLLVLEMSREASAEAQLENRSACVSARRPLPESPFSRTSRWKREAAWRMQRWASA